jgi:MFS family permease
MMFVNSAASFYTVRVLLGVAEAGFFPGAVYFMTQWFPDARRARVMGLFCLGAPLSFVFGGPLSGFLFDADGTWGLHGWQWMFLIEGLLASVVGCIVLVTLADSPAKAKWLTREESDALSAVIAAEERDKAAHGVHNLLAGLLNWRVIYLGVIYFLIQICVSGVVYYLPAQVGRLLGRNVGLVVGLVTAIPWACAIVACIVVQPLFWTFPAAYLGGGAAAAGLALVNTIGALAGFVAPNYRLGADVTFGAGAGLYALGLTTVLGAIMIALTAIVLRPKTS